MDSSSSKVTTVGPEKVTDKTSTTSISYHHLYPCDLLEEAVRALLKCFVLDNKLSHTAAGEEPQPETSTGANAGETGPSTLESADPSNPTDKAAAADPPPSSTSETTEIAAVSVRAARPIGTGRGPQIN